MGEETGAIWTELKDQQKQINNQNLQINTVIAAQKNFDQKFIAYLESRQRSDEKADACIDAMREKLDSVIAAKNRYEGAKTAVNWVIVTAISVLGVAIAGVGVFAAIFTKVSG